MAPSRFKMLGCKGRNVMLSTTVCKPEPLILDYVSFLRGVFDIVGLAWSIQIRVSALGRPWDNDSKIDQWAADAWRGRRLHQASKLRSTTLALT